MITPTEHLRSNEDIQKAIEDRIDDAIRRSPGSRLITISCSLFPSMHHEIEAVLKKYRAAGWKAQIVSDWRDGDYVELKP